MPWVQADKKSATGVNPAVTMGSIPSLNDLLIAVVGSGNSVVPAMTASGVAWSAGPTVPQGTSTLSMFYKLGGGSEVAAQSATAGNVGSLVVFRYTGGPTSTPLDVSAVGAASGANVTDQTAGTTAAVAATGELVIAAVRVASAVTSPAWTSPYVSEYSDTRTFVASLIAGTGAQTTDLTWVTATHAAGIIAAFNVPAAVASIIPQVSIYRQVPFRG